MNQAINLCADTIKILEEDMRCNLQGTCICKDFLERKIRIPDTGDKAKLTLFIISVLHSNIAGYCNRILQKEGKVSSAQNAAITNKERGVVWYPEKKVNKKHQGSRENRTTQTEQVVAKAALCIHTLQGEEREAI